MEKSGVAEGNSIKTARRKRATKRKEGTASPKNPGRPRKEQFHPHVIEYLFVFSEQPSSKLSVRGSVSTGSKCNGSYER